METFDFNNIYHCYILGLLWGDGYVSHSCSKKVCIDGIRLETLYDDSVHFEKVFQLADIPYVTYRRHRPNRKPQQRISLNNRKLEPFLKHYGFLEKSYLSPNLMMNELNNNKKYWMRGFLDADGCIYLSPKNKCKLSYSGSYAQDWYFVTQYLSSLDVSYGISRQITKKNHKYSAVNVSGIKNNLNLMKDLYSGNLFGLERKYNKYLEYKSFVENKPVYDRGKIFRDYNNKRWSLYRETLNKPNA